jgi:hypothetical protein
LTAEEMAIAIRVARAMADGPFVSDCEFLAVMGYERPQFQEFVTELESASRLERRHESVIGFALLNATMFPHRRERLLAEMAGVDMASIHAVATWWSRTRKPIKVERTILHAGPVIWDGWCFREIRYQMSGGYGHMIQVWRDGRWSDAADWITVSELPEFDALPAATDVDLRSLGVNDWQVPKKYNPFVRGEKRRQRRKWRARIE